MGETDFEYFNACSYYLYACAGLENCLFIKNVHRKRRQRNGKSILELTPGMKEFKRLIIKLLPFWWSSGFSKSSLNIWKFMFHILLKPGLENFEHYHALVWNECNCAIVWSFFGISFLWNWNKNWAFPFLWPLLSFPDLLAALSQHHL